MWKDSVILKDHPNIATECWKIIDPYTVYVDSPTVLTIETGNSAK